MIAVASAPSENRSETHARNRCKIHTSIKITHLQDLSSNRYDHQHIYKIYYQIVTSSPEYTIYNQIVTIINTFARSTNKFVTGINTFARSWVKALRISKHLQDLLSNRNDHRRMHKICNQVVTIINTITRSTIKSIDYLHI